MKALNDQYSRDPDSVFGGVAPCSLDGKLLSNASIDIFKGVRDKKLKLRGSSAVWKGKDALTEIEVKSYKAKMGYF